MQPKTINRTHDLAYHAVSMNLVKTPGILRLFKVIESYKGRDLYHWWEDENAVKYRLCNKGVCGQYGKKTETKYKWICQPCLDESAAKVNAEQMKIAYKKRFEQRVN